MSEPSRVGLRPVSWALLGLAALTGALLGLVSHGALALWMAGPPVPEGTAIVLALLAFMAWALARNTRIRIATRRDRIDPARGLQWLAGARTALWGGALTAGFFAAWVAADVDSWEIRHARLRLVWSTAAVIAAALLVWAGRRWEDSCYVPPPESEDSENPGAS